MVSHTKLLYAGLTASVLVGILGYLTWSSAKLAPEQIKGDETEDASEDDHGSTDNENVA